MYIKFYHKKLEKKNFFFGNTLCIQIKFKKIYLLNKWNIIQSYDKIKNTADLKKNEPYPIEINMKNGIKITQFHA